MSPLLGLVFCKWSLLRAVQAPGVRSHVMVLTVSIYSLEALPTCVTCQYSPRVIDGGKGPHRQSLCGQVSVQCFGGAVLYMQSALMQFSSTVQVGHVAAMHRRLVQGIQ